VFASPLFVVCMDFHCLIWVDACHVLAVVVVPGLLELVGVPVLVWAGQWPGGAAGPVGGFSAVGVCPFSLLLDMMIDAKKVV